MKETISPACFLQQTKPIKKITAAPLFVMNNSLIQSAPSVPGEDFMGATCLSVRPKLFKSRQLIKMSSKCCDDSLTHLRCGSVSLTLCLKVVEV